MRNMKWISLREEQNQEEQESRSIKYYFKERTPECIFIEFIEFLFFFSVNMVDNGKKIIKLIVESITTKLIYITN